MAESELTFLLGLFKGNRFSYARAIVVEGINTSFIDASVADDLRCHEKVESLERVEIEMPGMGRHSLYSVCVVDRVVFDGYEIPYPSVIHVARSSDRGRLFEAYIGKDLISYWQLYTDPARGLVRSRAARRVKIE